MAIFGFCFKNIRIPNLNFSILVKWRFLSAISKISGFPTSSLEFWSNEDFWLLLQERTVKSLVIRKICCPSAQVPIPTSE
jgi:hypothetical protein